jgi:sugar lactone lactonase YvrE
LVSAADAASAPRTIAAHPRPTPHKRPLTRRQFLTSTAKLAEGGAFALAFGQRATTVFAQQASPMAGSPLPPGCTVVASDLMNPRFVTIDNDGALYVSEAGVGGDETLYLSATGSQGSPAATPAPQRIGTRGTTGQVSKITPDGAVSVVASGLPSYAATTSDGPSGIVYADGQIWLAISGAGAGTPIPQPLPLEQSVVQIDPATGTVTQLADLGAYKRQNSPNPETVDTNTFGLGRANDGVLYVADAAGNALFSVNPTTNEISPVALFPDIQVPAPPATPAGTISETPASRPSRVQAVPTGIAIGPSDEIYVGELTGWPYIRGLANVLHVQNDGTFAAVGTGLTMVAGVAIGPDGHLYASELSLDYVSRTPALGRIVRIGENGANEVVVDGLSSPLGITFDPAGNLYIVTNPASPAGVTPNGMTMGNMSTPTP